VPLIDLDRMPLIDLADEHQAAREETWFCLEWETGNLAMHMVERDLGRGGALRP
jgi:7-cyano-7-deazaguanine synthase in queuosine biosynthesis